MISISKRLKKINSLLQHFINPVKSKVKRTDSKFSEKDIKEHEKSILKQKEDNIESTLERKIEKSVNEEFIFQCKQCKEFIPSNILRQNNSVCHKCNTHYKMTAKERIKLIFDDNSVSYLDEDLKSSNPLNFPKYSEKLKDCMENLDISEAIITGKGLINNNAVYFGVMDYRFIMASMGTVVGEKIVRLFEASIKGRLPVVIFCASGGARMQEGILSLYQMARVSAVIKKYCNEGLLYISVLTDPTYGGATASFASLGDIIIAERNASVGFAGKRIIENIIRQRLPKEFQTAEFMLKHGLVDYIVDRKDMKDVISNIIEIHSIKAEDVLKIDLGFQMLQDLAISKSDRFKTKAQITAWEKVQLARNKSRPNYDEYIKGMIDNFIELHGDRYIGDDPAIVGGIGYLEDIPVTVIFNAKGKSMDENLRRNFGMAHPEGYKKALRLIRQAEKFKRPVICFVDTPGAFCGVQAEERGQGIAIAECLKELIDIDTPIITIITGEGGSGGALAMSVSDWTFMLENSVYSIISPESCAEIIFKDRTKAKEVAEFMKLTSFDLQELNIIDEIIKEPDSWAHNNKSKMIENIKYELYRRLIYILLKDSKERLKDRYMKIMNKARIR